MAEKSKGPPARPANERNVAKNRTDVPVGTTTFSPSDGTVGSVEHQSVGKFLDFVMERKPWNISQLEKKNHLHN